MGKNNHPENKYRKWFSTAITYKDRITFFHNAEALADSTNDGFYITGTSCGYRFKGEEAVCDIDALPEELKGVVHAFCKEHVYYVS